MQIFNRIKTEKRCTMETCAFGGNVRKIQGFYERNIKKDGYISTLNKFGLYGVAGRNSHFMGWGSR